MSTLSAAFLECTPYTSVAPAPTSTVFVTSYIVVLPAACPTSEWEATYTVTTTCTGDSNNWTPPAIPPEFGTTTVTCGVCSQQTQTIICPNAAATNVVVQGNGVTVTVAPTPAGGVPGTPANTGAPGAPTVTPAAPGQSNYVTVAGAPLSMKKSLGLMAGLAIVAGQFLML